MRFNRLFLLTFLSAVGSFLPLAAQYSIPFTVSSTGTNPVNMGLGANGAFYVQGGTGTLTSGEGPQPWVPGLLWYPNKAAFFEGYQQDRYLGDANIGYNSAALVGGKASGDYSFSSGGAAIGNGSSAMYGATASGGSSFAQGWQATAQGYTSIAEGFYASCAGDYSVALGAGASASAYCSLALGNGATASGGYAVAFGASNTASSGYTFAAGMFTLAQGVQSTSFGSYTHADCYESFVLGTYNIGGGSSWNTWVPTDPLFEIGNGTDSTHPSDAVVVYKNGNVIAQGTISCAASGDIPMYGGN